MKVKRRPITKPLTKAVKAPKEETKLFENAHKLETLYWFVAVVNDGQGAAIVNILNRHEAAACFLCHGSGTATSDFYHVLGFDVSKKQVVSALTKKREWPSLKKEMAERFAVSAYSKGIAFVIHVDSICGVSAYKFVTNTRPMGLDKGDIPMEEIQKDDNYEMIMTIVNDGYTDLVMDAAKKAGARGGTILHARGTGNKDIEKFFGVAITPEKQIVMVLVPKDIKDAVIASIYQECGINTKGQGIAFAMPVSDVIGIVPPSDQPNPSSEGEPATEDK
jgi:Nitrogen regulatory protein P-II.